MSNEKRCFVISSFIEGEGFHVWTPINEKDITEIEKITGHPFFDDLSLKQSVEIKEITPLESIQSRMAGAKLDGVYSVAGQIRYLIDHSLEAWEIAILKAGHPEDYEKAVNATSLEVLEGEQCV